MPYGDEFRERNGELWREMRRAAEYVELTPAKIRQVRDSCIKSAMPAAAAPLKAASSPPRFDKSGIIFDV